MHAHFMGWRKRWSSRPWKTLVFGISLTLSAHGASGACDPTRSESLSEQGRYEAALEAVKSCGTDAHASLAKGLAFHGLYRPDSALFHLKRAFDQGLRGDGVRVPLAEALLWKRDFRNAADLLSGVQDKNAPSYLKVLAHQHEILGEFPEAVAVYDRLIAMEKLPYGSMERKGIVLSWMKRFDEAIAQFDAVIRSARASAPLKIRCRIRKAEVLSWKGRLDDAQAELDRVLASDSRNVEARMVKGKILEWKEKYALAAAEYRKILEVDPSNAQATLRLERVSWADSGGKK